MKYLILKRGAKTIAEKKLDELPVKFKVGAAYSHILTENDRKVSVPHLEVERHKRDIFIQDLGSAFGTFVNGTAVERRYTLQDGDVISLGEHTLAFVERENSQDLPEESSDSTSLTTGPEYELVALQGPYKGTRYALADTVTHIGRERDNHVVLRQTPDGSVDNSISRKHAAVSYRNGRFYVRDLKSGNGTLLNGERLAPDEEQRLYPDDEIEIISATENTVLRFVASAEAATGTMPERKRKTRAQSSSKNRVVATAVLAGVGLILVLISMFASSSNLAVEHEMMAASSYLPNAPAAASYSKENLNPMPHPALTDVNRDGLADLIFIDPAGHLNALDLQSKSLLWPSGPRGKAKSKYGITLADLNGDNRPEILVAGDDSRPYIYDGVDGHELWRKKDFLGGSLSSPLSVGDLNGDGQHDIVVATMADNQTVLNFGIANGAGEFDFATLPLNKKSFAVPTLADTDADGKDGVLLGLENGEIVYADMQAGRPKGSEFSFDNGQSVNSAIGFLPHLGSSNSALTIVTTRRYDIFAIDLANSSRRWSDTFQTVNLIPRQYASPLIGDVDGNDQADVVFTFAEGFVVYADGTNRRAYHAEYADFAADLVATPALMDLNQDGAAEVIVGDSDGKLHIFDIKKNERVYRSEMSQSPFTSSPVLGDIDGNGMLEIVALDDAYNVHLFHTNTTVEANAVHWNQHLNAANHTGFVGRAGRQTATTNYLLWLGLIFLLAAAGYWLWAYVNHTKTS